MDPFERLLGRTSSEIDGHDANRALWDARAELESRYTNVVCYEMVVADEDAWSTFLARTIPRVTEHLVAKGLPMLGAPSALLAVWRGSKMFLFESREFFAAVREIEELDEKAFWKQIAEWRMAIGLPAPREALIGRSPILTAHPLALAPVKSTSEQLGSADVRISEGETDPSEIRTDE